MLARPNRLAKDKDVSFVFRKGRALHSPFWTMRYVAGHNSVRATFVVSTKVSKKAVQRNRFKRVLREAFRVMLPKLAFGDYAFIVKAQMPKEYSAVQARSDLEFFFRKHKLIK